MSLTSTATPSATTRRRSSSAWAPRIRVPRWSLSRTKVHGDAVRAGVKHHLAPYPPGTPYEVDGLRVLDRPRTALDMVREHGRAHGLAACDAAMRQASARATAQELAR